MEIQKDFHFLYQQIPLAGRKQIRHDKLILILLISYMILSIFNKSFSVLTFPN